jgi:hypothetical protein
MGFSTDLSWWQIAIGLGVTLLLGRPVKTSLDEVEKKIKSNYPPDGKLPAPEGFNIDDWNREVIQRTGGGDSLAFFERIIFFSSFASTWALAASYLAFKLASKWKSWTTTWQAVRAIKPKSKDDPVMAAKNARAHLARTGYDHRLFLLGTAGNLVAGLAGFAIAKFLPAFVAWLCALSWVAGRY